MLITGSFCEESRRFGRRSHQATASHTPEFSPVDVLTEAITPYFVNAAYSHEFEPTRAPLTVNDFYCASTTHAHRIDLASIVMAHAPEFDAANATRRIADLLVSTMTHSRAIDSACKQLTATGPFGGTVTHAREFLPTVANVCMKTISHYGNVNPTCTAVKISVRFKTMPLSGLNLYCDLVLHAGMSIVAWHVHGAEQCNCGNATKCSSFHTFRMSAADDYTSPTYLKRLVNVSQLSEFAIENDLLTVFSEIEQHVQKPDVPQTPFDAANATRRIADLLVSTMTHARAIDSACKQLTATGPFGGTVTHAREFLPTVANVCMKTISHYGNVNPTCTAVKISVRFKTMPLSGLNLYCDLVLHAGMSIVAWHVHGAEQCNCGHATKCSSFHTFRMSTADDYTSPTYLKRLVNVSQLSEDAIENDLLTVFSEIEQHVRDAEELRSQWFQILSDNSFRQSGGGEQVLMLSKFRATAGVIKERLPRFGTRFLLTDQIYQLQVKAEVASSDRRLEWLGKEAGEDSANVEAALRIVERAVRRLNTTTREVEERTVYAERALRHSTKDVESSAKSSTARADIVKVLTERIEVLERTASQKADEQNESLALKTIVETVAPKAAEQLLEKDDEYMQRLLDEVRDEGDLKETADEVSDEDEPSEKRARPSTLTKLFDKKVLVWQINSIKAKIKIMEMTLKNFPYRKLGETGKGVEP
ncbi:unnamed protein product, partial [Heligmosomoides polygyrus]|uniref:SET domain-containing protein n=1 Tax=Heligmosomoides polygyrus TaxID=6339 RepID=A0A183GA85_HELPZ